MRLVLDTNVWLDWLVFADAGVTPVKHAVARGVARVFMSSRCEAELARVLGYALSGRSLDARAQAAALSHCRSLTHHNDDAAMAHAIAALPRCADPDDQMFLELARDCGADFLLTKDRDLLALAVRKVTPLPFRIVTPRAWARDALPNPSIG
jgi:putative PIN family toxin of toxin-antitoxin system